MIFKRMMAFVIFLVLALVCLVMVVRYLEKNGVFFPTKGLVISPAGLGLPYEDVYVETPSGVRIHGWLIKNSQAKATVFFCHGNAGNIGDRLLKIKLFYELGLNIFIFDYRGYGLSEGSPTEDGVYEDAFAAYDTLVSRQDVDPKKIVGYGASLGSAVLIHTAGQRSFAAIIIDSAFSSGRDMAKLLYPYLPTALMHIKLDSFAKIKTLTMPKLFIHSIDDKVVPIRLGKKLFDAAPPPKTFVEITGGHNEGHIYSKEKFLNSIQSFLNQEGLLSGQAP